MNQLHEGHRNRLRQKFHAGAHLEKHELLELLLFYVIPRRNTNEIAHRLLNRFGSLRGVLDADISRLTQVEGVGLRTALFLRIVSTVSSLSYAEQDSKLRRISTEEDLRRYVISLLLPSTEEEIYLLLFSGTGHLIHTERLAVGLSSASQFSLHRAVQLSCQHGASSVVLAHNHPDGLPVPSDLDVETTERFREALNVAGIELINHYIVCGNRCVSVLSN